MEFLHPGASRPAPRAARTLTVPSLPWRSSALRLCVRPPCDLRLLPTEPSTIFGSTCKIDGPSRHQPHSVAALQDPRLPPSTFYQPQSLRTPTTPPPPPRALLKKPVRERVGLVTDTRLASVLRNGRALVTHLCHGSR